MASMYSVAMRLAPALGIWIVACSGGSGGGDAVSADKACSDFANAACQALSGCTAFLIQDVYGDAATCGMRLKASCSDTLAAAGTGLTPALREGCVTALSGASCVDLLDNDFPAACQPVAGQLANGSMCGDSSQCKSAYCNLGVDGA